METKLDEEALALDQIDKPLGAIKLPEEEFKTYFGAVGKYRFNVQAASLYRRRKILGDVSLEESIHNDKQWQQKKPSSDSPLSSTLSNPSSTTCLPLIKAIGKSKRYKSSKNTFTTSSTTSSSLSTLTTRRTSITAADVAPSNTLIARRNPARMGLDSPREKDRLLFPQNLDLELLSLQEVDHFSDDDKEETPKKSHRPGEINPAHGSHRNGNDPVDCDSSSVGTASTDTERSFTREQLLSKDRTDIHCMILSPRSKFIANCIQIGLNPRLGLIIRQSFSTTLNLAHMGMGDKVACVLAESIRQLPHIQSIDVSDNNLTDDGMAPLLRAMVLIRGLLQLNLSQNVIGLETAAALSEYIQRIDCPLEKLVLRSADVDDFECAKFANPIKNNSTLTELDMSCNKIGTSETLNTVFPDFTTGGEALATLLREPKCGIKTLKLGWNSIRLDSGVELASSLADNNMLTYLDLSYNCLGKEGGETLGNAIIENKTLRTLILNNNGLGSRACFTICVGIVENFALTKVSLDGNPIGDQGAQAVMAIPISAGSRVNVTSSGCNIEIRDAECTFDYRSPCRKYELDLEDHFARAQAFALLQLGACHQSYIITRITHNGTSIELEQKISQERLLYLTDEQREHIDNLQSIKKAAENKKLVKKLFKAIDVDGIGVVSQEMFAQLLRDLGMQLDEKAMQQIISEVDIDGSGEISLEEVLFFLMQRHDDVSAKLADLTEFPVMALKDGSVANASSPTYGLSFANSTSDLLNDGQGGTFSFTRFVPPKSGTMVIELIDGVVKKPICKTLSSNDYTSINKVAAESGNLSNMLSAALITTRIRFAEAFGLYEIMYRDTGKKTKSLALLLPHMVNPAEARQLIATVIGSDKTQMQQLKTELGQALRPICGSPDGFYCLDLSFPSGRLCLTRLLEISQTQCHEVGDQSLLSYKRFGDTSFRGNWSCFRNELFNGKSIVLSSDTFDTIPQKGKLEFDFMSCYRQPMRDRPVSDNRFLRLLQICCLLPGQDVALEKQNLAAQKKASDGLLENILTQGTAKPIFSTGKPLATDIAVEQTKFYARLAERAAELEASIKEEVLRVEASQTDNKQAAGKDATSGAGKGGPMGKKKRGGGGKSGKGSKGAKRGEKLPPVNANSESVYKTLHPSPLASGTTTALPSPRSQLSSAGDMLGSNSNDDFLWRGSGGGEAAGGAGSGGGAEGLVVAMGPSGVNNKRLEQQMQLHQKFSLLTHNPQIPDFPKAAAILDFFDDEVGTEWISCRQLALFLRRFQCGRADKTSFGSYRVEVVVSCFSRLIDTVNFELIRAELTAKETACLYCRIGWLKLFNPLKPDGAYELELERWEERMVAKMLIMLKIHESGENWRDEAFQWNRESPVIPGWLLPELWLTDENVPVHGILSLNFTSSLPPTSLYSFTQKEGSTGSKDSKANSSVVPNVPLRRSLCQLVYLMEKECVTEEVRIEALLQQGGGPKGDDDDTVGSCESGANIGESEPPGESYCHHHLSIFQYLVPVAGKKEKEET